MLLPAKRNASCVFFLTNCFNKIYDKDVRKKPTLKKRHSKRVVIKKSHVASASKKALLISIGIVSVVILTSIFGYNVMFPKVLGLSSDDIPIISQTSYQKNQAFLSQGNFFEQTNDNKVLLFIKDNKATAAIYQNGNWNMYPSPISDLPVQKIVSTFNGDKKLYVVLESNGTIVYKEITLTLSPDGIALNGWVISPEIILDNSTKASSPTIELVNNLPVVSWTFISSNQPKLATVRITAAKNDPLTLSNWCKINGNQCGIIPTNNDSGFTTEVAYYAIDNRITPMLVKINSNKVGLWFFGEKDTVLKRIVFDKNGSAWNTGNVYNDREVGGTTEQYSDITGVYNTNRNQAVIAFKDKSDQIKVLILPPDEIQKDVSFSENNNVTRLSLGTAGEDTFLFYVRNNDLFYKVLSKENTWGEEKSLLKGVDNSIFLFAENGQTDNTNIWIAMAYPKLAESTMFMKAISNRTLITITPTSTPTLVPTATPTPQPPTSTPTPTPNVCNTCLTTFTPENMGTGSCCSTGELFSNSNCMYPAAGTATYSGMPPINNCILPTLYPYRAPDALWWRISDPDPSSCSEAAGRSERSNCGPSFGKGAITNNCNPETAEENIKYCGIGPDGYPNRVKMSCICL